MASTLMLSGYSAFFSRQDVWHGVHAGKDVAVKVLGKEKMDKRSLNKFKAGSRTILVATDVASRGLDIPAVRASTRILDCTALTTHSRHLLNSDCTGRCTW